MRFIGMPIRFVFALFVWLIMSMRLLLDVVFMPSDSSEMYYALQSFRGIWEWVVYG